VTRHPKRRWKDPAKRAEVVVRLREKGMSFRAIAADLHVSVGTVHSDLIRWTRQQAESMIADVQSTVQSEPCLNTRTEQEGRS
jgi:lambda repressor-like predicted transcriptional regulator